MKEVFIYVKNHKYLNSQKKGIFYGADTTITTISKR